MEKFFLFAQFSRLLIQVGGCDHDRSDCIWIYNCLCNQCLSPLTLWVQIALRRGVLDAILCDNVSQCLAAGRWFSPGTPVSSTNKTDLQDLTEILLKVALNMITLTLSNTMNICFRLSKVINKSLFWGQFVSKDVGWSDNFILTVNFLENTFSKAPYCFNISDMAVNEK